MTSNNRKRTWIRILTLLFIILGPLSFPVLVNATLKPLINGIANRSAQPSQGTLSGYVIAKSIPYDEPFYMTINSKGVLYVTERNNNRVQKINSTGTFLVCGPGSTGGQVNQPDGIDIDALDNVYIADAGNDRVIKLDSDGKFVREFKGTTESGSLDHPMGVAVDNEGNIYIADSFHHRIKKFDSEGKFLLSWGSGLESPENVDVTSSGRVYVGDEDTNTIFIFDSSGNSLGLLAPTGSGEGQVNDPEDLTVDKDGNIYVSDSGNNRIQKFDTEGNFATKWGSLGTQSGNFNHPRGVVVDKNGTVYIADTDNNRIQEFVLNIANLRITVKDSGGKTIAAANVSSTTTPSGQTTLNGNTDTNGIIIFNNILSGGYVIKAEKTGYTDATSSTLNVPVGGTSEAVLVLTAIAPTTGDLKATVRDSIGTPLAEANVTATSMPSGQSPLSSTTKTDGVSIFNGVKAGSYTLRASKSGYLTASSTITVTAGSVAEATITLIAETKKGSLRILVRDTKGAVKGATVSLTSQAGSGSTLTTGDDGSVTFSDVDTGNYSVKITMTGYATSSQNTTVTAGDVVTVNVTLQVEAPTTGNLKVTIKDQDGRPLVGADVSSESQPSGAQPLNGSTNDEGVAAFNGIQPGSYILTAQKSGYSRSGGGVSVTVVTGSTIEATVTLTAQQPQGGTLILPYLIAAGVIILLVGALILWKRTPKQLKLIYSYGIDGKNTLDTFNETFTSDRGDGQATTVKIKLTATDLEKIEEGLKQIGFFDKPDSLLLPSGNVVESRMPFESYYLKVKTGDRVKELRWDDKTTYDGESSKNLEKIKSLLSKIIEEKS